VEDARANATSAHVVVQVGNPEMWIHGITNLAEIEIHFSEKMLPVTNLTLLNNSTVQVELPPGSGNFVTKPTIEVEVLPGFNSDEAKVFNYTYNVTEFLHPGRMKV